MNEFFRIKKDKIWISVIIIIISLISFFYIAAISQCYDCPSTNYSQFVPIIISLIIGGWPILLMYLIESLIFPNIDWITSFVDLIFITIGIIFSIFYVYALSCMIDYIYRKIKGK